MPYQIEWKSSALREFKKLPAAAREEVEHTVEALAEAPRPVGCKKLAGMENTWRLRLGNYRLIYEIRDKAVVIYILRIRPRRDSYRDL